MKAASQMNDLCIHPYSLAHVKFFAHWQDDIGEHTAIHHVEKFNVWRDIDLLPQPLINDIMDQPVGRGSTHSFKAGEILPIWQSSQRVTVPAKNFTGRFSNGQPIQPRVGRFYPKGMISGINNVYSENMFPTRVVEIDVKEIVLDYNQPLAGQPIDLEVEIVDIFSPVDEHGGRCNDVIQDMLTNGPGMQIPYQGTATDFFVKGAFDRIDETTDSNFYQQERKVHHLDANARQSIAELYGKLISNGGKVLDLMASWESHLPQSLNDIQLSGQGMNEAELKANPQLGDYCLHDLNQNPVMPYENESFDAVICTASVEYLIQPLKVFAEIRRILRPGGQCIMTFSNRWFPTKSIALWAEMHEFERVGLVVEYFRQSGWVGKINTLSSRGLHRPVDDPHYAKTQISDPVYAVWSQK